MLAAYGNPTTMYHKGARRASQTFFRSRIAKHQNTYSTWVRQKQQKGVFLRELQETQTLLGLA